MSADLEVVQVRSVVAEVPCRARYSSAAPPESFIAMEIFLIRWMAAMKSPTEKPKAGTTIFVARGGGQMIELRGSGGALVLLSLALRLCCIPAA